MCLYTYKVVDITIYSATLYTTVHVHVHVCNTMKNIHHCTLYTQFDGQHINICIFICIRLHLYINYMHLLNRQQYSFLCPSLCHILTACVYVRVCFVYRWSWTKRRLFWFSVICTRSCVHFSCDGSRKRLSLSCQKRWSTWSSVTCQRCRGRCTVSRRREVSCLPMDQRQIRKWGDAMGMCNVCVYTAKPPLSGQQGCP